MRERGGDAALVMGHELHSNIFTYMTNIRCMTGMYKRFFVLFIGLLLVGCASQTDSETNSSNDLTQEGWTSLFNGEDFSGWRFASEQGEEVWSIQDGVIDCEPQLQPQGDKTLWTEEEYGDFQLRIDWRLKRAPAMHDMPIVRLDGTHVTDENGEDITRQRPNADSGVYLRGTPQAQLNIWRWPIGSGEVYGYRMNEDLPADVRAGVTPSENADRPIGEWNTFEVTMEGDRLTVVLNGRTVLENARLPDVPESGPVGLQHHGGFDQESGEWNSASSLVQFRNIYIKEL
jgi:hypothetical protein